MLNSSQSRGGDGRDSNRPTGELRAFVATRVGGFSWVVDLIPNYDLTVGSHPDADIRIDVPGVRPQHASLRWDGEQVQVAPREPGAAIELNGSAVSERARVMPGDEIRIAPATLVVNITFAPARKGRRSLTHHEFAERVFEEMGRVARTGRATCLVMLKSRSGDGSRLASAAIGTFREGDIVGTYAHDEIEFLLPDTPPNVAKAVVERLLETSGAEHASAGLAVAPEDGDTPERLMRSARDALAEAMERGGGISRPGGAHVSEPALPSVHSAASRTAVDTISAAAEDSQPILLVGEPSSGKRHYARLYHDKGERSAGPFVLIQCAGLVDAESVARAFGTGEADVALCQAMSAKGGTLVLDEIGDLPLQGQKRLLALLTQASSAGSAFDVVSTTHRDLLPLCSVGVFSRELFDRIAGRTVVIPALRMRTESILPLAQRFAEQYRSDRPVKLSAGAIDKMRTYSWPGNVLELRNAMERAVTLADGGEILAEHLPGDLQDGDSGRLRDHVGSVERDAIIKALADNNYNQTHAARILGISRRALIYKMEKYGLKPPPAGRREDELEVDGEAPEES